MTNQPHSTARRGPLRALVLGGTAIALVMGGALLGSTDLVRTTPALADPVRVEGVRPFSFADVVEGVRPAVVSVRVKTARAEVSFNDERGEGDDFFFDFPEGSPMDRLFREFRRQMPRELNPRRRPSTSLGSGFVISEDGLVVTNNHVIDENDTVEVLFDDGSEYLADVVGTDDRTDLALLRLQDTGGRDFTYVKFSEDDPRVGDWVVAVGNPFGLGGTVTAGIISAHGRQIGAGPYDDFLQIDAAINRGNSGGPAFNYQGEVVGVNTAIFSPSGGNVGIAFAIPAPVAERIIDDLMDDGQVVRGWLGVQIQTITDDIAASLRLGDERGALVSEVNPGSPAEATGLRIGDAVTAVNGKAITDSRDLAFRISGMEPGETAAVTVWRDGRSFDIDVELGTLPSQEQLASLMGGDAQETMAEPEKSSLGDFGLTLAPAEDGLGVAITDVDPNGHGAERGLQPGDVILSVGDGEVATPADVEQRIAEARDEGLEAILLRVRSGERTQFVALRLGRS